MAERTGGFSQKETEDRVRKYTLSHSSDRSRNHLNPLSYLPTPLWSSLKICMDTVCICFYRGKHSFCTFCRSSCSFLSMASSCNTFSSRWPGESLQHRCSDSQVFSKIRFSQHQRWKSQQELVSFHSKQRAPPASALLHWIKEINLLQLLLLIIRATLNMHGSSYDAFGLMSIADNYYTVNHKQSAPVMGEGLGYLFCSEKYLDC